MRGGFLHGWRGGGAPANWGRWGQLASGERSLKEGGEDREACQSRSRQMSGQLPQDPSATPPPPAHRMLTSFHPLPKLANVLFSACTLQTPATPNSAHFHAMDIRRICSVVLYSGHKSWVYTLQMSSFPARHLHASLLLSES